MPTSPNALVGFGLIDCEISKQTQARRADDLGKRSSLVGLRPWRDLAADGAAPRLLAQ